MASPADIPSKPWSPPTDEQLHPPAMGPEWRRCDQEVEVTQLCREAASTLGPNEMIHDPEFSLYTAMSALELMDAKMDKAPLALESLESRMASGALPTNLDTASPTSAAPAEVISPGAQGTPSASQRALSVLDGMAVCEVAWHEGASLPETLYACLYLHPKVFSAVLAGLGWQVPALVAVGGTHPKLDLRIKEGKYTWKPADRAMTLAVLAQSLATLRCCSMARDVIILADIFEEEDFYPSTFGFRLSPPLEDESLTDLLDLAEEAVLEQIAAARSCSHDGATGEDCPVADLDCILAHLKARQELLKACLALRDAFTNKQRQRRLKALATQRANQATADAAIVTAGGKGDGSTVAAEDDRQSADDEYSARVDGGAEVASAAAELAAMTLDSAATTVMQTSEATGEHGEWIDEDDLCGELGGDSVSSEAVLAGVSSTQGGGGSLLAIEGTSVGSTATGIAPPPAPTASESSQDVEPLEVDDIETPIEGIARCEGHLGEAVIALDSLLALDTASVGGSASVSPAAGSPAPMARTPAERHRPAVKGKATPCAQDGAKAGTGAGGEGDTKPEATRLGGAAGEFAFEVEMNRHLLGSSPQHHVHFRMGPGDGSRALRSLAREAQWACGVVTCQDLSDVRRYLLRFSQASSEDDEPAKGDHVIGTASLFARSVAAVCLHRDDMVLCRFNVMWFVAQSMTDMGVPDAVVNSPAGMAFLERVAKPVYETLRVLCLNRARQRRSLEVQMQDWRVLQTYADTVDEEFRLEYGLSASTQRYTAKWALSEVLGLMHRYLQIGVELQLPSAHEWPGTYWYWDFVMTTKLTSESNLWEAKEKLEGIKVQMEEERTLARAALEAAEAEAAAAEAAAPASPTPPAQGPATSAVGAGGKKGSKKKKRGGKRKTDPDKVAGAGAGEVEEVPSAVAPVSGTVPVLGVQKTDRELSWRARRDWDAADMNLRQCLCRGYVRLLAGLDALGMMGSRVGQGPEFRFTKPDIVHRERFRAFQALDVPAFQMYSDFLAAVAFPIEEASRIVDSAGECFREARSLMLEQLRRGEAMASAAAAGGSTGENGAPHTVARGPVSVCGGGWATEKAELLVLVKIAVSNGVAALQVAKRSGAAVGGSKRAGGGGWGGGRAVVEFGAHSQFPVVRVTFD